MTVASESGPERLVKSAERVRDLGEVFTPTATVQSMLDLIPDEMWLPHPSATFLEPSCGNGNFLVAVLNRKLTNISRAYAEGTLPAGPTSGAAHFHALQALASIYAVDVSVDNVVGGTPGHEVGARGRLLAELKQWHEELLGGSLSSDTRVFLSAQWVVKANIHIGNMLPTSADGLPSGRHNLPFLAYKWNPERQEVSVAITTLGDIMAAAETETEGTVTLFGSAEPRPVWNGKAMNLFRVPNPSQPVPVASSRSGRAKQ